MCIDLNNMEKLKNFFKNNYLIIINYLVLLIIYGINKNMIIEVITGLWLFASAAIGLFKLFKK